jgi:ubiquinone/menaquinone biosynthesis C-methylase UbiE
MKLLQHSKRCIIYIAYQTIKRFLLRTLLCRGRILDVGCGAGSFASKNIVGMDIDAKRLRKCQYRHRVVADAQYIPFRSDMFNTVLEMGVMPYVPNHIQAVEEMKRVGKRVYLIEPLRRKQRNHWFPMTHFFQIGYPFFFILRTFVVKVK